MKTGIFFPKQNESLDKTNILNFSKKFEDTTVNNEIDQNYQKIVDTLDVNRIYF